jgi:short-subunit dehydrogenase
MRDRPLALVTGASSGIGAAYARRLAADGHDLVLVARRTDRLQRLAAELADRHGTRARVLTADLADRAQLAQVADRAAAGDLTMLVNNAGVAGYAPFTQADPALIQRLVTLHVLAPTLLARAATPGLRVQGHGAIVNVCSLLAFSSGITSPLLPARVTYAAAKAYLLAFSRALACELAGTGLRVQALLPPVTDTEFHLGADPAGRPPMLTMRADDVVQASLTALRSPAGEVICLPGNPDSTTRALEALADAEQALLTGATPELAARYRSEHTRHGPARQEGA